jgi:hypothetical protein
VSVTAPPRPPRPGDPVERDELEALIEEARQRARRRRRKYTVIATLLAFVGLTAFIVFERTAQSQSASPAPSRVNAGAQAVTSRIAFVTGVLKPSRSGSFLQTELYVMNADGSGKRRLVRDASSPVWSPDGLKLASRSASARRSASVGSAAPRSSSRTQTAADSGTSRSTLAAAFRPGRPTGGRSRSPPLATAAPSPTST